MVTKKWVTKFLSKTKKPKIKKKDLLSPLVILLLAIATYFLKNQVVIALVNGQPIWRWQLIRELEKQSGKAALESLITEVMVLQEAKKQKVSISNQEVNQEIEKIETTLKQQDQDLSQLLAIQGMTRTDLKNEIKMQKTVEVLVVKETNVSEEEVESFYEENKESFAEGQPVEEIKNNIRQRLEQERKKEAIQTWLQSLYKNAKIYHLLFKEESS